MLHPRDGGKVFDPVHGNILKKQRSEIEEVVDTIHNNINQQRSDLKICLPELKGILFGLMEEQFQDINFLAGKLV